MDSNLTRYCVVGSCLGTSLKRIFIIAYLSKYVNYTPSE
jgi:hypothetical protein